MATELLLLDDDDRIDETTDDELRLLLELDTGVELPLPTIPKGAGCAAQVERAIQLRWSSQPHPLVVVTHSG